MTRPPRWAERILTWVTRPEDVEFVLGDLEETFLEQWLPVLGPREARRRYRTFVFRSVLTRLGSLRPPGLPSSPHATRNPTPMDLVDTLRKDLAFGFRSLRRRPSYAATIVLTLALAIGANTAMFTVVDAVLLRPLPYPQPDRLVTLWQASTREPDTRGLVSGPNFRDWKDRSGTVSQMASYRSPGGWVLTGLGDAEEVPASRVSEDFFETLGVAPLMGRGIGRDAATLGGPHEVVVSERFWRERMSSDPDALERILHLEGIPHQVVGVAAEGFSFPEGAELWISDQPDFDRCGRGCVGIEVVGRLAPDATVERARAEFEGIARAIAEENHSDPEGRINVVGLEEITVGHVRTGLFLLLGAVGLVLLIACANVANLLLAVGSSRAGEVATRAALGASRGRIVRQLLTESGLLSALGGVAGLLIAWGGLGAARGWLTGVLPRDDVAQALTMNPGVLSFALLLVIGAALVFGLVPALGLSRSSLSTLIGRVSRGGTGGGTRSGLLVVQVSLAVVLLLGMGLLLRTMSELRGAPVGFDPNGVVTFSVGLPSARYDANEAVRFHEEMLRRVTALPEIASAGAAFGTPLEGLNMASSIRFSQGSEAVPDPEDKGHSALLRVVTPGYLETVGIPLLRGRAFAVTDDTDAPGVVLVSRSTADRWWPGEDPIGKEIRPAASVGMRERPRHVIGVVGDVRSLSVRADVGAEIYIPHAQSGSGSLTYVVRPHAGSGPLVGSIRDIVREMDGEIPVPDLDTMERNFLSQLAQPRLYTILLTAFALLALSLAGIGLYGTVSYHVARRRREIGLRMAIGARANDIMRMVVLQGMGPAVLGVVLGLVGGIYATKLLRTLLYNVGRGDPVSWSATVLLILAVVLVALLVPTRRATRVEPSSALRTD